jgi:hypothetical protein
MNKKRPMTEVVDKKEKTIPEVVHEYKETNLEYISFYSSTTSQISFYSPASSIIGLFLFIPKLWYRFLFIHPQPLV